MKDYDIFRKIFSPEEVKKEVNISHNLEELLEELKESLTTLTQVAKNLKEYSEEKLGVRPKRKRVHYYFCKENGTNLAVTEILNPFDQREISNELMKARLYYKKSELKIINELICLKIRNVLQKNLELHSMKV